MDIHLTYEEAEEIVRDMSVSDHESQAISKNIQSISKKIAVFYPELFNNREWMLVAETKE